MEWLTHLITFVIGLGSGWSLKVFISNKKNKNSNNNASNFGSNNRNNNQSGNKVKGGSIVGGNQNNN
ncbi:hypothetical protein [Pantoea agglomerans]|jgi:hypothetical protein|uniref:hypothetical protein n=1 Tax=Enterobacter agglomerans TaxID=549 RepID=UPI00177DF3F4|nr:hypothetical protein [Pantoea agglomerans]MBD8252501.1 hypothetical protein [Pantoea agglomerans]